MSKFRRILPILGVLFLNAFIASDAEAKNLHTIDEDKVTGFALYRLGDPDKEEVRELCELGVEEIMVLSGDAKDHEYKYKKQCPTLKVVYNTAQAPKTPVGATFLAQFDKWVQDAQVQGKKIAFRCSCGCHRTGRLAAYYRMKYNGWDAQEAIDEMWDLGKWMIFLPYLNPQVRALEDYVKGRECRQKDKYCVRTAGK